MRGEPLNGLRYAKYFGRIEGGYAANKKEIKTMIVKWRLSIGYPTAIKKGSLVIPDDELEGMTEEQIEDYISESVHDNALQYVDTSWEREEI